MAVGQPLPMSPRPQQPHLLSESGVACPVWLPPSGLSHGEERCRGSPTFTYEWPFESHFRGFRAHGLLAPLLTLELVVGGIIFYWWKGLPRVGRAGGSRPVLQPDLLLPSSSHRQQI